MIADQGLGQFFPRKMVCQKRGMSPITPLLVVELLPLRNYQNEYFQQLLDL